MLRIYFLLPFLLSTIVLLGQSTGLLVSEEKYKTIPLLPTYSGAKYNEIPLKVSLKKYCPLAGDQRQMGACVGWAVGYGAFTIMQAQEQGISDPAEITEIAYSAAFIYNQIKQKADDCSQGAYIEDALTLLKTTGDCLEKSFNYSKIDCRTLPDTKSIAEAQYAKLQDYATLFELSESPKNKVAKACKVLATKTPIVVGLAVTPDFFELRPGTQLWDAKETEVASSYHAMVLVGYDNVEKQFELLNSFGTSWGSGGFIKVKYDDFERLCRFAYVLVPRFDTLALAEQAQNTEQFINKDNPLSGTFGFRKPAGYLTTSDGEEIPFFEEVATIWNEAEGIYTTKTPYFEVGDIFQLVARDVPKGRYAYVFSRNPDGEVNLHFPKAAKNIKVAGFMLEKNVEIIIPSEETALQLTTAGTDYLCVVYSSSPILDVEQRLEKLSTHPGSFVEILHNAFSDLLIPATRVQFYENNMSFTAFPNEQKNQIAVALMLKVNAK